MMRAAFCLALLYGVLVPTSAATDTAQKIEPSDLDDLNSQMSDYFGRVHATNKTMWMRECVEYVKRGGFGMGMTVPYSTYYFKDKPSGMCNLNLWSDFYGWTPAIQDVFTNTDLMTASYDDIEDQLPTDTLPAFMSFPQTAKDVSEIVKFANDNSMKVSIKNSGHSWTAGSSSTGSLQINLRKFPKYSFTHIYECDKEREYTSLSESDSACKLALARGKTAVTRVGGGQGNDDMYRSVIDFNYAEPRKNRYHVLGGAEGMIGGGGGYLMGGGLARGEERTYGCAADQVLELEMILPDGQHVKFGPTEWEERDGYEYPQTTKVEGKCNENIHHDESKWQWVDCDKPFADVTFEDLWWAVRGGGGGVWGVVLSSIHQLHELLPQYRIVSDSDEVDSLNKVCTKLEGNPECPAYKKMLMNMWVDFTIDLLWNEDNKIGVDKELSRHCGFIGAVFGTDPSTSTLHCHGHGIQEKFNMAWQQSISLSPYILDGYGEKELCSLKNLAYLEGGPYDKWHRDTVSPTSPYDSGSISSVVSDPIRAFTPIGHYWENRMGGPAAYGFPAPELSILFPASLLATKSEKVMELLTSPLLGGHTIPYASQSDGMTSLSSAYHSGGVQATPMGPIFVAAAAGALDPQNPCVVTNEDAIADVEKALGEVQDLVLSSLGYEGGSDIPGFTEYNHVSISYGGVLKSDPTKPCPFMSTSDEKKELCLSIQETVWGSANFRRLSAIKNGIDPSSQFDVYFGIGNDERAGPMSDYCAPQTDPTVPPLTGWDSTPERVSLLAEECKVNTTSPTNLRVPLTKKVVAQN